MHSSKVVYFLEFFKISMFFFDQINLERNNFFSKYYFLVFTLHEYIS